MSGVVIGRIQKSSNNTKNDKPLRRCQVFIWVLFATYTILWIACGLRTYTQGFLNEFTFTIQAIIRTFYLVVKIELFAICVYWTLDLRLTTQVLRTGQVLIIGFDSFERECLRFYMNRDEQNQHNNNNNISSLDEYTLNTSTVNRSTHRDGEFRQVREFSERDDLTSDAITESLMSPPMKQTSGGDWV